MVVAEYDTGLLGAIRNKKGLWINTSVFREEGTHFLKYGYYTSDPWGSPAWFDYWQEQRKRCMYGYSVGGAKITGEHYFYMNFCQIKLVENTSSKVAKKVISFPHFWDGDYNFFWVRHLSRYGVGDTAKLKTDNLSEAERLLKAFNELQLEVKIKADYLTGGYNLIIGKSRRKGYSFKMGAVGAYNYFMKPDSLTILNAYEKKFLYPEGVFTMTTDFINFININTAWVSPSDKVNKVDQIKASFVYYENGIELVGGLNSSVIALTCKDNADVNRGKDAEDILIDEAGAFGTPGLLKDLYVASEDCVKAGALTTGLITINGTSGDLEKGTADYADMHSRPGAFNLLPFNNIWDKGMESSECGFFHPIQQNMEGFYDEQGNSDIKGAKEKELEDRAHLIAKGATSSEIQKRMQEKPIGPAEAFSSVSVNNFPVVELKQRLLKVKSFGLQSKGIPIQFVTKDGELIMERLGAGKVTPITSLYNIPTDIRGCPVIYEQPIPNAPKGLYKIGYDPIRQDEGSSLASIIVYKGVHKGSVYHDIIVAEYVGRLATPEDIDRVAMQFAIVYNTKIMYENEIPGTKNFFRRIKRLDLLAHQPDRVISKNIKKSSVARVYGCHMNAQLKDAGERYVKEWLLTVLDYDENDNPVTVIDRIDSIRLLEELIAYTRKGNFDLVSALFMCMMQVQEEELGKTYEDNAVDKRLEELSKYMKNRFKRN